MTEEIVGALAGQDEDRLTQLSRIVGDLVEENTRLSREVAELRAVVDKTASQPRVVGGVDGANLCVAASPPSSSSEGSAGFSRRRTLSLLAGAATGAVAASTGFVVAGTGIAAAAGVPLESDMRFNEPLLAPVPLDTPIGWTRRDSRPYPQKYVTSILSLLQEGVGVNSYPWPLFVQVRGTDDRGAVQDSANAFGVLSRFINPGPGFGSSFFADLQHFGTPTTPVLAGTSIGYDVELYRTTDIGRTIGVNILNASPDGFHGDHAINIQSGSTKRWRTGVYFDPAEGAGGDDAILVEADFTNGVRVVQPTTRGYVNALVLDANTGASPEFREGTYGVSLRGRFNVGIDLGSNLMRMNAGTKILLENTGYVYLWFNPTSGKVEIVKGTTVVASW